MFDEHFWLCFLFGCQLCHFDYQNLQSREQNKAVNSEGNIQDGALLYSCASRLAFLSLGFWVSFAGYYNHE
jgi:hypothetical protein